MQGPRAAGGQVGEEDRAVGVEVGEGHVSSRPRGIQALVDEGVDFEVPFRCRWSMHGGRGRGRTKVDVERPGLGRICSNPGERRQA